MKSRIALSVVILSLLVGAARARDPQRLPWAEGRFVYSIEEREVARLELENRLERRGAEVVHVFEDRLDLIATRSSPDVRRVTEARLDQDLAFLRGEASGGYGDGADGFAYRYGVFEGEVRILDDPDGDVIVVGASARPLTKSALYRLVTVMPFEVGARRDFDLVDMAATTVTPGCSLVCEGATTISVAEVERPAIAYVLSIPGREPRRFFVGRDRRLLRYELGRGHVLVAAPLPLHADRPAPRPEDVATLDGLVASLYEVISGPAGADRDWARFRSLFHPEARLAPLVRSADGRAQPRFQTPEEYAARSGPWLVENGFLETEIHRTTERFGALAQVFSTYESRRRAEDEEPFARGINAMSCCFDGERWWLLSVTWEQESPERPIPARYLPGR